MRSEQTYIPYDFRRLVVYAPEIKQGTGIWQPVVGHDGLFPMGRVEKQEARPVSYGELNLPTQIAERFEIWAKRSIDAPLHGSINLFDRQSHYKEGALLAEDLAIFLGDRCQVDFDGNRVLVGFDQSKISNEFLYGNQYASVRNTWDFTFPSYRTYLARLLWRGISPKERGRLFPGKFDLGNRQHVQLEDCKNSSLVFELGIEEDFVEIDVNGHPFKSIEDGVKSTLGRSLESYKAQDASSAYKVVKLLFRMQKLRHKRLFKFLEMPKPDDVRRER